VIDEKKEEQLVSEVWMLRARQRSRGGSAHLVHCQKAKVVVRREHPVHWVAQHH
jgi:hypothetical protein